jgi:catechol 2,3-dioxygenase-like lactoylglutathione lyase family enzyme
MAIEVDGVCPYFEVYDIPTSIHFYRDLLGFEIVSTSPALGGKDKFHWCMLRLGPAYLMLNDVYEFDDARPSREEHMGARKHRDVCLFFGCPDVDGAYADLLAKGVVIDRPPKVAHYGMKQLYFSDPDGFGLCFQWKAT